MRAFPFSGRGSLLAAALCFIGASLHADPIATPYLPTFADTSSLGPAVVTDDWTDLSSTRLTGYPGISGSQTWPASIAPDASFTRQAFFLKTPGYESDYSDFLDDSSGGGIYSLFSNTHFEMAVGAPASSLTTLQLQLSVAEGATPADVVAGPTLTLVTTAGTFELSPNSAELLGQTPVTIPAFGNTATTINLEGYQWNLAPYTGTITGLTIDWQVDMHSITYGGQVAEAVPEPSGWALLGMGGGLAFLGGRRFCGRTA